MIEILHEYKYGNKTKKITKIYGLRQYCSKNGISFLDFITEKYNFEYLVWNRTVEDYHCKLCKKELNIKKFDFENKKVEFLPCKCCIPEDKNPSIIIKNIFYSCFDETKVDEIYDEYKNRKIRSWTTAGIDVASKDAFIKRHGEEIGIEKFRKSREFNTTKLDYWLRETDGNEEEARLLLRKRQSTFSLEKCIEKYGKEGQKVWQNRQDKWQETLLSKSEEEQERINQLKMINGNSISEISQHLFKQLYIDGCRFGKRTKHNLGEKMIIYGNQRFMIDFTYKNKIIEFFGDYWHANPLKYKSGQKISRKSERMISDVDLIWEKDKERISQLEELGYEVKIIWESDYRKEPKRIIQECKDFLCR